MIKYTVNVIIPTYKPGGQLNKLIQRLREQSYPVKKILIMNTEEGFFPKTGYENEPWLEVHHLPIEEFDHGGTRHRAAILADCDLMLFMTQDAAPADNRLIENLVRAFKDEMVWAAYARQLPKADCREVERWTRQFNYPDRDSVKSKGDLPVYGIKTFFCSNVCAMYRKDKYMELGGFEKRAIFNEDMIYAGNIIRSGGSIAYVSQAKVYHSHNYGNLEQLHRNFDLAVSQADHPEIFRMVSSESEGIKLVKQTMAHLCKTHKPWLIPGFIINTCFKYMGFLLGKSYKKLPKAMINKLTMNRSYWR